jgi:hypothetical protein
VTRAVERRRRPALFSAAIVAVFACFFGVLGCKDDRLVVRRVLIDVDPVAVSQSVDRERVRQQVGEVLAATRGVVVDEARADGQVLRVRVESFAQANAQVPAGHPVVSQPSTLSLSVDVADAASPTRRLLGHSLASAQGVNDPHALVEQALREALGQVLEARRADALDGDVLLAWLTEPSSSKSQREQAMAALASRGDRRATAGIVAVLQAGDPELNGAALRALALLGDENAVDAIIAWSDRQPPPLRKLCIDAVKATGSPRGLPWLFTLSSGHPDADVQAHAQAALAALQGAPAGAQVAAGG